LQSIFRTARIPFQKSHYPNRGATPRRSPGSMVNTSLRTRRWRAPAFTCDAVPTVQSAGATALDALILVG